MWFIHSRIGDIETIEEFCNDVFNIVSIKYPCILIIEVVQGNISI